MGWIRARGQRIVSCPGGGNLYLLGHSPDRLGTVNSVLARPKPMSLSPMTARNQLSLDASSRSGLRGQHEPLRTLHVQQPSNYPTKYSERLGKRCRSIFVFCRSFARSRYLRQSNTMPSHGRGRWFDRASPTNKYLQMVVENKHAVLGPGTVCSNLAVTADGDRTCVKQVTTGHMTVCTRLPLYPLPQQFVAAYL